MKVRSLKTSLRRGSADVALSKHVPKTFCLKMIDAEGCIDFEALFQRSQKHRKCSGAGREEDIQLFSFVKFERAFFGCWLKNWVGVFSWTCWF